MSKLWHLFKLTEYNKHSEANEYLKKEFEIQMIMMIIMKIIMLFIMMTILISIAM